LINPDNYKAIIDLLLLIAFGHNKSKKTNSRKDKALKKKNIEIKEFKERTQ
jgi:hypothetical protein